MKNILFMISLALPFVADAQTIIGNTTGTATDKTSVLLDFSNQESRGIVLPYITTLPTTPTEGSIMLNATTPTAAKIQYYNGSWIDLTGGAAAGDITAALAPQQGGTENAGEKAIIGATNSSANGVLVLESTTKAMVLPTVTSTDSVPNPAPGMMVYVNGAKKLVAVYNGAEWSFWE